MGIEIPTLCHDKRLAPTGSCRLCVVEAAGSPRPLAACATRLTEGARIETHSPAIEHAREMNLKMLARKYPVEAFAGSADTQFHKLARRYGLSAADFGSEPNFGRLDDSHTYIRVDMSRCIDCYACVRICDEVQGQFVWTVVDRGQDTRIVPDSFGAFGASSCVSCGACSDVCPTGALQDRSVIEKGEPAEWTRTTCPYCGVGCEMDVGTRDGHIVQVRPSADAPVNYGHLCVKGRYAFGFVDSPDRVTSPMLRRNGEWVTVTWDEAIAFTAGRLREIALRDGKESIAVLGSARATNEENYVAQKFTRVCLETNNVDCCARVCHTPSAAALKMMLGTGAATNSFDDIERAETFLVCGANPNENHPVVGARIKQAVHAGGANLIVIDPRVTELAEYADIHLRPRPGTNVPLLNAMACTIVAEGLCDLSFAAERVTEFAEFAEFVRGYTPESVAEICGVAAADIRGAARLYATAQPSMCFHGLGVTEHTQGTEGVMCLINLALITGNIGKPGTGVNPLRGQNNVQGSAHMGCDPGILTGSIAVDAGRERFESVWRAPVPTGKGLNVLQMIDAAHEGKLKALWAIGYDIYLSNADAHYTEEAFENVELMIVQDIFMNETARRFGHVFFPAACSFEKDGTFMNGERRVQRVRKAVEPPGEARTDWEIVCDVARAMGKGEFFGYGSAEDIWNEIRAVWPEAYGITYERMEHGGLQWNCPDEGHPGTEVLHAESFAAGKTAALRRIKYRPTRETVSEEFPLLMNTGRNLYQFNAGTMTERTPNLELRPSDTIDICPTDAQRLAIADGERVVVRSRYGEAVLPARISRTVAEGEVFATFHSPHIFLNRATGPHRDRYVQSPEFKVTAVKIDKIDGTAADETA
jgi:formate dehydrogenase major subunit